MEGKFYVTTPIYYPSSRLHIGHAYTTTVADALARWHRFLGKDVFFLTGSDEHGQKIQRTAAERGITPKEYVDDVVESFKELWQALNIQYDDFIRTTDARHHRAVQEVFRRIYNNGDIYKSKYEGLYCVPCETFWLETKLQDGNCPDCGRPVELVEEESYFFRMGKYADRLLQHIEEHPEFIQPETRRSEMVNFIKGGLDDLCVTRSTFDWGVPVPIDEGHVIYVWFDAVTNYLTAAGFPDERAKLKQWWPADVHLVGKEIMRFHTIIWPIILMALGEELPKTVFGHGWLLFDSDKMSKSKGNVIDPHELIGEMGEDPIRYFLLREVSFGQDGNFSRRALIERTNADLANDLGNLLHRTLSMLGKYYQGVIPEPTGTLESVDLELQQLAETTCHRTVELLDRLKINEATAGIWRLVARANKYVDECAPWTLAKGDETKERLATVMYNLMEVQRITTLLIKSLIPRTSERIWQQLGIDVPIAGMTFHDTAWGGLKPGTQTQKGEPLFPRMELEEPDETAEVSSPAGTKPDENAVKPDEKADAGTEDRLDGVVGIEDFAKLELVIAEIKAAGSVKNADKLLKIQVDVGGEERQIVAGIAEHYQPEDLIGRRIVVVKNLKPVKLRGEWSEGMLLAATSTDGSLELVSVSDSIAPGSPVK